MGIDTYWTWVEPPRYVIRMTHRPTGKSVQGSGEVGSYTTTRERLHEELAGLVDQELDLGS